MNDNDESSEVEVDDDDGGGAGHVSSSTAGGGEREDATEVRVSRSIHTRVPDSAAPCLYRMFTSLIDCLN